ASNTGTTMSSSFFTTHNRATTAVRMTSKRHAQAAALRTSGSTAVSSGFAGIWPAYPPRGAVKRVRRGPRVGSRTTWAARSGYDDDTVGAAARSPRHLHGYPKTRVARRTRPQTPPAPGRTTGPRGRHTAREVLVGAMGGARHRRDRSCRRD